MPQFFALLLAAIAVGTPAAAQDYPTRTVRVIIPLGPGGGGDIFTRALTDELQKRLGQSFIVENRAGGGLNIGTRACAEAAPDGYTICILSSERSSTASSCSSRCRSIRSGISSQSPICSSTRSPSPSTVRST